MSRAIPLLILLGLVAWPEAAHACSTCMDPKEGNRTLLSVTVFLSLLPLTLMASIGGYFWWRLREGERLAALPAAASPDHAFPADRR